ncbi:MAG: glycosyltransferase family 2 protein [Desulfobacterales bacterium]|nr:glycosyltransferase family 2 protein [Desulfobacterales bacterium]
MIGLSVMAVIISVILNFESLELVKAGLNQNTWGTILLFFGGLFLIVNILAFIWRVVLFWKYRPAPSCSDTRLPMCSVIVPAYNEGRQVLKTLRSIAASDYPADKLQIIAVDDGSVDDTWKWICRAAQELNGRVKALRLPINRGKRHALYTGFLQSQGEVLVTIDSDSMVDPQTLRCLISPFVHDRQVGAVAGNVRVLNRQAGIIPLMLDVVFLFSFDFIRAGQSMVNTVMCTPGALSAYRKKIVMRVLMQWRDQKFFGNPANIGEDRAMTNLILREGYHVHFQQTAMVHTNVPTGYSNLCKMFLRWARSNIRETLVMSTFAFHKFRQSPMLGARINLLLQWLSLTKSQLFLLATFGYLIAYPLEIGLNILLGIVISSTPAVMLYSWRYRNTDGLWNYVYGIFWFFSLSWITLYALITPHRTGWLTRQIKQEPEPSTTLLVGQKL